MAEVFPTHHFQIRRLGLAKYRHSPILSFILAGDGFNGTNVSALLREILDNVKRHEIIEIEEWKYGTDWYIKVIDVDKEDEIKASRPRRAGDIVAAQRLILSVDLPNDMILWNRHVGACSVRRGRWVKWLRKRFPEQMADNGECLDFRLRRNKHIDIYGNGG